MPTLHPPTPVRFTPPDARATSPAGRDVTVARRIIARLFGAPEDRAFSVTYWDGTVERPRGEPAFALRLRSAAGLRRMVLPPREIAFVRAYLSGDVDVEGDMESAASLGDVAGRRLRSPAAIARLVRDAATLRADRADGGAALRAARGLWRVGRRHSAERDRRAVRFHYDVGNDFYAVWLDERMVYSCGYFPDPDASLEDGQVAKLDLVCRKLRLEPGHRFLDIGCGWGALVIHAAVHYGVHATGITLSEAQATLARERVERAGVADRVRIAVQDYRTLLEPGYRETFDRIASIGMVEHVGARQLDEYFAAAHHALAPGGVFLNHGIVSNARARGRGWRAALESRLWGRNRFIREYVFPDGDLLPGAVVLGAAERNGFELRDVESLREHYVTTLRHWLRRLEARAADARAIAGEGTYRIWRLYMAGSAYGFRTGRIGVIQALLARPRADGSTPLPRSRADLYLRELGGER